jgi:predicted HTH domain antitoxin
MGKFAEMLKRSNKNIREDRADAIIETAQVKFRRMVEDLEIQLKEMERERENMLDLSPTDARSLKLASDFNADEFVGADIRLGVKMRETEIKLEIAIKRYEYLFGTGPGGLGAVPDTGTEATE